MNADADIAREIADLRKLSAPDLVARYQALIGKPPRVKHSKEYLVKRLAWKAEEARLGGLSTVAKERLESLMAEIQIPPEDDRRMDSGRLRPSPRMSPTGDMRPGTVIVRQWHGRQVILKVVEGGFEVDGTRYPSLSAAAFGVTKSKWNGPLFWQLTERKKK